LIEVELGIGASNRQFYDLVWPQADMVLRYARVLSGSASDAEDLAQESLLKAYRAIDQFKPGTEIRAWLITILRHAHIDWVRKRASHRGTVSLDSLEYDPRGAEWPAVAMPNDWEQEQALLEQFGDASIIEAMQRMPTEVQWTLLLVDVVEPERGRAGAAQTMGRPTVGTGHANGYRGFVLCPRDGWPKDGVRRS